MAEVSAPADTAALFSPPAPVAEDARPRGSARPARLVIGTLGMVITAYLVCNAFLALAYYPQWFFFSKPLIGFLGIVLGIGGAMVFFRFLNMTVEGLPARMSEGLIPYAFLLPGLSLIGLILLYPTIQTIVYSFANADSTQWVGLENYRTIFGKPATSGRRSSTTSCGSSSCPP